MRTIVRCEACRRGSGAGDPGLALDGLRLCAPCLRLLAGRIEELPQMYEECGRALLVRCTSLSDAMRYLKAATDIDPHRATGAKHSRGIAAARRDFERAAEVAASTTRKYAEFRVLA